jgi:transcriptional regulator with XRE-family HTH domain
LAFLKSEREDFMLDYTDMRPEAWDAQTPAAREIRQFLDRTHQTAKQLADAAGMSPSRISDCLAGKGLSAKSVERLSAASGIPTARLLGREGSEKLSDAQAAILSPAFAEVVRVLQDMDDRAPMNVSRLAAVSAFLSGVVEGGTASHLAAFIELSREYKAVEKQRPITPHLSAAASRGKNPLDVVDNPPTVPDKAEQAALAAWRARLSDVGLKRDFARFQTEQAISTIFDYVEGRTNYGKRPEANA